MNKKAFEFSFGWIFSMIVGAVILFIAVYAATQFIDISRTGNDAQVTEQIGIILDQIETSSEDATGQTIEFPDETRIYNECHDVGNFGEQVLSSVTRSNVGREWKVPVTEKVFLDKYIFSSSIEQGEDIQVFVKQFEMPYDVADFVYIFTENYCFVQPPSQIENEINNLNLEMINVSLSLSECLPSEISVCFAGGGCDVNVDLTRRVVLKESASLYYGGDDSLLYGAIFADKNLYECQTRRALKRAGELAQVYASKSEFLVRQGCPTGFADELRFYARESLISDSSEIDRVVGLSENLEDRNDNLECEVF